MLAMPEGALSSAGAVPTKTSQCKALRPEHTRCESLALRQGGRRARPMPMPCRQDTLNQARFSELGSSEASHFSNVRKGVAFG